MAAKIKFENEWHQEIWVCLGSSSDETVILKAKDIADNLDLSMHVVKSKIAFNMPAYKEAVRINKLSKKLLLAIDLLCKNKKSSAFLDASTDKATFKNPKKTTFEDVVAYIRDLHAITQEATEGFPRGIDNRHEKEICEVICRIYEKHLNQKPTVYDADRIKDSQSPDDGTVYERICYAVEKRFGLSLSYNAKRQAAKSYIKAP